MALVTLLVGLVSAMFGAVVIAAMLYPAREPAARPPLAGRRLSVRRSIRPAGVDSAGSEFL